MALILIIDDEKMMREVLRDTLEGAGYRVLEADDGVQGVELFCRHCPDLVITDILMPNKGGLHVIAEVRKLHPGAKIVAMSGGGRDGKLNFLSTARTFPGVMTLNKPCPRKELLAAVGQLLDFESQPHPAEKVVAPTTGLKMVNG